MPDPAPQHEGLAYGIDVNAPVVWINVLDEFTLALDQMVTVDPITRTITVAEQDDDEMEG